MKQFTSQIKRSKVLLCMLIPALAYVILFCYIPMTGVSLAFKNFKYALGIFKSPWCGWDIFGSNGVLNSILAHFGVTDFSIYKQVKQWPIVLVLVRLWKQTGYGTVVYLAAIAGIGKDLYEAASIDGASVWQKIRYITLPSLKPTIMIMVLLALGNVFRGDFGMFYQLVGSNQLLLNSSDILDTYIYRMLTTSPNVGLTAAAGLYQSILCFVTILTANWIVKKIDPEYTLF